MTVSELISKIDIQIGHHKKEIDNRNTEILSLEEIKAGIQSICTHRNPDGTDAYEEYAHNSHHRLERCTICQKEVTV